MNKNLNFSCEEDNLMIAAHLSSDSQPTLLKDCIDLGKTPDEKDIILLSALTAASAVMPHYFFRYGHGGKKYYPNLQTFIMASAASGKGMASVGLDLVRDIHKEHEILIPGDSTYPAFFTQLWAQDGIGYMHESEGSVITDIWKSGAMSYNTALRKAAEHEPITRNRIKDGILEIPCPRLSMLLTGTFGQFRTLVPSVENGFFSRLTMLVVRGKSNFDPTVFTPVASSALATSSIASQMLHIYHSFAARKQDTEFRLTDEQASELGGWFEREYGVLTEQLGENFHSTLVRMGITAMRIAAILTAMDMPSPEEEVVFCPERFFRAALLITGKLILHAADAYNQIEGQKQQAVPQRKGSYQKQMLLHSLPQEFSRNQGIETAERLGVAARTTDRWLQEWCAEGVMHQPERGRYMKICA